MPPPRPYPRPPRALTLLTIAACSLPGGCDRSDAREPSTVAEVRSQELADSAAGDRAALVALPPALQQVLRLEPYLDDAYLRATPSASCLVLDADLPERLRAERRRVRMRLPDSSAVVVYVRAAAGSAALERVEIVRRPPDGEQLGFIWDSADDGTLEVRWPAELRGGTEAAPQPRGGPVPRAVRALGRRVLTLDCAPATARDTRFEAAIDSERNGPAADVRPSRSTVVPP